MVTPLALVVLALASYRLWRLAALDQITEPIRARVIFREGRVWEWVGDGLQCAWCLGFWCSLALWAVWVYLPAVGQPVAYVLAVSALVGALDHLFSRG